MFLNNWRFDLVVALAGGITCATVACAPNQSPDQLREKTAQATAEVSRNAKAMAEGVKEGLSRDKTVNVNKASKDDLLSLPGITDHEADRIMAERPFDNTHELVSRRVVSQEEYDKIKDRVIAAR
jgi:DNA uptake protein ComE-like DNA-binding protein